MEKMVYETPEICCLGTVKELTALNGSPVCGSADDFASEDNLCVSEDPY